MVTQFDAVSLAHQATFGPTETLVATIKAQGTATWVSGQMALNTTRYTSGNGDAIHKNTSGVTFCDQTAYAGENCWRDWFSEHPLVWDFYRSALTQPDQLRQRVALALQQIVVISGTSIEGTYGMRNYQNALLDNAFGNYRQVLKKVVQSPVMGDFLNNVNNDKAAPNENFARELLQLFSIGTCQLNADGTLKGGACTATYTNDVVRNYAFALTGWTYPPGGATSYGCYPVGANCRYYGGDMVPVAAYHDTTERLLLSGLKVNTNSTAAAALETVLDSLMAHPNTAPFIAKQMIQHLVTSNPSAAYVQRVSSAFTTGRFTSGAKTFGAGANGDLAATVAAVLLDADARSATRAATSGQLRPPALVFTGVLRALNGKTDGDPLAWWWGENLSQHMFRPPSVFSYYPPDYPVAGTPLVGPAFGIHNANGALERLNFLTYLLDWDGSAPDAKVPAAIGTKVDLSAFLAEATDATKLVDRLSLLALGQALPATPRAEVIKAVSWWTASTDATNWQRNRVRAAAYLIFASPNYQVQR